jgi:hypothetical protein
MNEFLADWQKKVDNTNDTDETPNLYFGRKFIVNPPAENQHRLLKQYGSIGADNATETMTSMRNVDTQVKGEVIMWED